MANNLVEYLASLRKSNPKRANWFMDCPVVGTNDWGFGKVKLCKEIIAGSRVRYDFKSAYSTNPTVTPVLSRAKVSVTAWWIPVRLYVPALRDGVQVKSGRTDYSFPTINFDYESIRIAYTSSSNPATIYAGQNLPYIPANSIYTELGMWAPYFQPIGFAAQSTESVPINYPGPKNAIPLLGYYDIFRNYFMNSQVETAPIRVRGYSKALLNSKFPYDPNYYAVLEPRDKYVSREDLDNVFNQVRLRGSSYQMNGALFNVTPVIASFLSVAVGPPKQVSPVLDDIGDPLEQQWVAFNDNHFGEWRDTYHSDYYTAFLSNENVEYERSTARVKVDDDGYINMEQIYSAQKVQNYIRSTVFKNSDYAEFVDVHYGVTPSTSITKPMFMGAVSSWLSFNDVISTVQGSSSDLESNNDLGSRASLGFGRMVTGSLRGKKDRPFVDFTAKEPGYFMVIETIVPEVSYWQGFDPMYDKHSLESLYYPEFDRDGYQDKQLKHLVEQVGDFNSLPKGIPFDNYNIAYAQEPAWWEYMTTFGRLTGQMVDPGVYRNWVFTREVSDELLASIVNPPTNYPPNGHNLSGGAIDQLQDVYVLPEAHNHIFANINGLDNIQTFYRHELKIYQPLSHRFLSY
ncbi:MAG: hypothetical protein IJN51_05650 [Alistipes sp.]|nr:hypothetical protein [Alistipes sp.]